MKRPELLPTVLAGVVSLSLAPAPAGTAAADGPNRRPETYTRGYTNPLPVEVADPYVLRHGGTYYLYGTTDPSEGFRTWTSSDLIHWDPRPFVFRKTETTWARDLFWAPCVVEHGGSFYLYYSAVGPVAGGRQSHRICAARADSPLGPFVDVRTPLLDVGSATIDAEVFVDANGQGYLYYSRDISENPVSEVYVVPLSADLLSAAGRPVPCIRPSQAWEGGKWNEAPSVFRHGKTYVMMYSARCFADPLYSVGYATAPTPLGPWKKADNNPILRRTDDVSGPGHSCVTRSPDGRELLVLYHRHLNPEGGHQRFLAMDRLWVSGGTAGGVTPVAATSAAGTVTALRLTTDGPTHAARPAPSRTAAPVLAGGGDLLPAVTE